MKVWPLLIGAAIAAGPATASAQVNVQALQAAGPGLAVLGQQVTLTGRIRLTSAVARNVRVQFVLADLSGVTTAAPVAATIDLPAVTPGVPQDFSRQVTLPNMPRGHFRWAMVVDPANALAEDNEFDNTVVSVSSTTLRRAAADLAVVGVRLLTPTIDAGDEVRAEVTVANNGENGTIFELGLALSNVASVSESSLRLATLDAFVAAGSSDTVTLRGNTPSDLTAGRYTVGAVADPTNAFVEVVESDNVGVSLTPLTVQTFPLAFETTNLPVARVRREYFAAIQASGGNGAPIFTLNGNLPDGLQLGSAAGASSLAVISGRPTRSGTFSFEVVATSAGQTARERYTLTVERSDQPLVVVTDVLGGGFTQLPYEQLLVAGGGEGPYTWERVEDEGELPVGLDLSPDGLITGSPQTPSRFGFTLRVTDSLGEVATKAFEMSIDSAVDVGIVSMQLTPVSVAQEVEIPLVAMGGLQPYRWRALTPPPPGTTLTENGILRGTADQVGRWPLQVEVVDGSRGRNSDTALVILVVEDDGAMRLTPDAFPAGLVQRTYEQILSIEGGEPPYAWRLVPGTQLPDGFFLEAGDGEMVKTFDGQVVQPDQARVYGLTPFEQRVGFAVRVEDSFGRRIEKTFGLQIDFLGINTDSGGCVCVKTSAAPSSLWMLLLLPVLPLLRRRK